MAQIFAYQNTTFSPEIQSESMLRHVLSNGTAEIMVAFMFCDLKQTTDVHTIHMEELHI